MKHICKIKNKFLKKVSYFFVPPPAKNELIFEGICAHFAHFFWFFLSF